MIPVTATVEEIPKPVQKEVTSNAPAGEEVKKKGLPFPPDVLALFPLGVDIPSSILTHASRPTYVSATEPAPVSRVAEYFGMPEKLAAYLPPSEITWEDWINCLNCEIVFDIKTDFLEHVCFHWR